MPKMTDVEIREHWNGLQRKHKEEVANAVASYCVGRSMQELADLLNQNLSWVQWQLDTHAMYSSVPDNRFLDSMKRTDLRQIKQHYGPKEPDKDVVQKYIDDGYLLDTAKRMALSFHAAKVAVEDNMPQNGEEIPNKLIPAKIAWRQKLRYMCNHVRAAGKLLEGAPADDLLEDETLTRVMEAHKVWIQQVERLQELHSTVRDTVTS